MDLAARIRPLAIRRFRGNDKAGARLIASAQMGY
jgi:hypothetical protein